MFRFRYEKTLQAVAVLLGYERMPRMNYMRLLKLLYIADRESLLETGETITGDRAVAMERGPVLSQVYYLIKGVSVRAGDWNSYVHTDRYELELIRDPGRGKLSKGQVKKLSEVSERYRDKDEWDMVEETHRFPEWIKNWTGSGATPFGWGDVFVAEGVPEKIAAAERDERARRIFDETFGD